MHPVERLRYVAGAGSEHPRLLLPEAADALAALADEPAVLVVACRRLIESRLRCGPTWWLASVVLCALDPRRAAREVAIELELDPTVDLLCAELPAGPMAVAGSPQLAGLVGLRPGASTVHLVSDSPGGPLLARSARSRLADVELAFPWEVESLVPGLEAVVVEAESLGPTGALVQPGAARLATAAGAAGVPVWLVAGVGCSLPAALWGTLLVRAATARVATEAGGDRSETPGLLPRSAFDSFAGPGGVAAGGAAPVAGRACPVAPELLHWPAAGRGRPGLRP